MDIRRRPGAKRGSSEAWTRSRTRWCRFLRATQCIIRGAARRYQGFHRKDSVRGKGQPFAPPQSGIRFSRAFDAGVVFENGAPDVLDIVCPESDIAKLLGLPGQGIAPVPVADELALKAVALLVELLHDHLRWHARQWPRTIDAFPDLPDDVGSPKAFLEIGRARR